MDAADPRIDHLSSADSNGNDLVYGTLLVHLGVSAPILHSKSSKREIPVDQSLWGFVVLYLRCLNHKEPAILISEKQLAITMTQRGQAPLCHGAIKRTESRISRVYVLK